MQHLEGYYNSFQLNHDQILALIKVDLNDDYFTTDFVDQSEDHYYETKELFNDVFHECD